jgi:RNA polymerase sigma factor (sigma-70 family)
MLTGTTADGLEALLRERAWMRRLARGLTGASADADDLVQDAWVSALQRPLRNPGASPRGWLATVLRNRQRNHRRDASRRRNLEGSAPATEQAPPEALLERLELQGMLAAIVTDLEEPYRDTVLYRYFEDLSSEEIARRMSVPSGTVRWRLKTALERIRTELHRRTGGRGRASDRWWAALVSWAEERSEPAAAAQARPPAAAAMGSGVGATGAVIALGAVVLSAAVAWRWGAGSVEARRTLPAGPGRPAAPDLSAVAPGAAIPGTSGSIEGIVRDPAGKGVPGVYVTAMRRPKSPPQFDRPDPWRHARSGADGTFRLTGLPVGTYAITATHGEASALTGPLPIEVDQTKRAILDLSPAGKLVTGRVLDPDRTPLPGARLRVVTPVADPPASFETEAGPDGGFRLRVKGADLERSTLLVEASGYASEWVSLGVAPIESHDVVLLPAARVAGRLVSAGDAALAGGEVRLLTEHGISLYAAGETRTDAAGAFVFEAVKPGQYRLEGRRDRLVAPPTAPFEVAAGARLDLVIAAQPGASVVGQAVTPQGAPVPDVEMSLRPCDTFRDDSMQLFRSGQDGRFHVDGVVPGCHLLVAQGPGWAAARREVIVTRAPEVEATLVVQPAAPVAGVIRSPSGAPLPGATVVAVVRGVAPLIRWQDEKRTDGAGRFRLDGLAPGTLHLIVRHPLGAARPAPIELPAQGLPALDIPLGKGAFVSGIVRWDDGTPAATMEAGAAVRDEPQHTVRRFVTDADGRFTVGPLPPGKTTVFALKPGDRSTFAYDDHRPNQETLVLVPDQLHDGVDLELFRDVQEIAGAVFDQTGRPVRNALIIASPERDGRAYKTTPGARADVLTDADGHFLIRGLSDRVHTVWAVHPEYGEASQVHVPPGSRDLRLRFAAVAGLAGSVVDASGRPVRDYELTLARTAATSETLRAFHDRLGHGDNARREVHDPKGAFRIRPLAAGRYDLFVSAPGGGAVLLDLEVPPGQLREGLRVVLDGGLTVKGRVQAPGEDLSRLRAALPMPVGENSPRADCNAQGAFTIPGVPSGMKTLHLVVYDRDQFQRRTELSVPIPPGATLFDVGTLVLPP